MFFPFRSNGANSEEAMPVQAGFRKQFFGPLAQRSSEPTINGHTESHLGPLDQLAGRLAHQERGKCRAGRSSRGKCQRQDKSAERPKRTAMPAQRGHRDLSLTGEGRLLYGFAQR